VFFSVSTINGNQELPFDMGFKNIEKLFKNIMSCALHRGPNLLKIGIFLQNGLFSVEQFL